MSDEIIQLREEVARLREDMEHVLKLLGETSYRLTSPRKERLWLRTDIVQMISGKDEHMPVEISASDDQGGIYFYGARWW